MKSAQAIILAAGLLVSGCTDNSGPAAAANTPMLIEPRVGVGKVRSGMTVQQVVAELGEPQRRTANALEYTRLGFAVMPASNGPVRFVMCGDVIGIRGPLVKAFSGRTKEGIGMNSTREEVVKAYGEPAESERFRGGLESMQYPSLGITFTLEGGKVHHMIVRLGPSQEPDRTISIEPAQK